jgi:hypothetical protein
MIDSTFLKEDKELMDYLNNVKLPMLQEKMKDDANWELMDHPLDKKLHKNFKEHFSEDWKLNYDIKYGDLSRYCYQYVTGIPKPQKTIKGNKNQNQTFELELQKYLKKHFSKVKFRRNWWWYKPKNWMAYHTNEEKNTMWRVYFVWVDEDKKSFLRYYDRDNDKVITAWDKKGWNINYFKIGKIGEDTPHCVWSNCDRLSLGFKVWT